MTHLVVSHCTKISDTVIKPVFMYIKKHYNSLPFQLILKTLTLRVLTRATFFTKGKLKKNIVYYPLLSLLQTHKYLFCDAIRGDSKGCFCYQDVFFFFFLLRVGSRRRNKSNNCLCVEWTHSLDLASF